MNNRNEQDKREQFALAALQGLLASNAIYKEDEQYYNETFKSE
jgi:hypothetical protein